MFCISCGTKLPDGAKFCFNCGAKLEEVAQKSLLVPAKCTNCGGQLTVDSSQKSAVCPFCGSTYIVEQAINNYNVQMKGNMTIGNATINVQGLNTENLIARAKSFESQNNFEMALDYFNKVLDIDVNNVQAVQGINRIEQKKNDYVFLTATEKSIFSTKIIEAHRDRLTLINKGGKKVEYYIKKIVDEKVGMFGSQLSFHYDNDFVVWNLNENSKAMLKFIEDAKLGIYPDYK